MHAAALLNCHQFINSKPTCSRAGSRPPAFEQQASRGSAAAVARSPPAPAAAAQHRPTATSPPPSAASSAVNASTCKHRNEHKRARSTDEGCWALN